MLGLSSERPGLAAEGPQGTCEISEGLRGQMGGQMDKQANWRMDGRTYSPCILQEFVPSDTPWGRCPAYMIATIQK